MPGFTSLNGSFSVAAQISVDDVAEAKSQGFSLIICNRPDGEEAGQPEAAVIAEAAREAGLDFMFIPISGAGATAKAIHDTRHAIHDAKGPILAYCRSGTRSTTLWSLAQAVKGNLTTTEILKAAAAAGYDMGHIAGLLEQLRNEGL